MQIGAFAGGSLTGKCIQTKDGVYYEGDFMEGNQFQGLLIDGDVWIDSLFKDWCMSGQVNYCNEALGLSF